MRDRQAEPSAEPESPQPGTAARPAQPVGVDSGAEPPVEKGMVAVEQAAGEPGAEEESLKKERDALRDQLLRKRAEFENYRKRVERGRDLARQDAVAGVFRELLPTLDDLDRALDAGGDEASLRQGVALVRRDLLAVLEGSGVVAEQPRGERFDPERHQALLHAAAPGFEEGTIVEVFRKGYRFGDRLLRPALVKVAKAEEVASDGGSQPFH